MPPRRNKRKVSTATEPESAAAAVAASLPISSKKMKTVFTAVSAVRSYGGSVRAGFVFVPTEVEVTKEDEDTEEELRKIAQAEKELGKNRADSDLKDSKEVMLQCTMVQGGICHVCGAKFPTDDYCRTLEVPYDGHPSRHLNYCHFNPVCYFSALKSIAKAANEQKVVPVVKLSGIKAPLRNGTVEEGWTVSFARKTSDGSIRLKVDNSNWVRHVTFAEVYRANPEFRLERIQLEPVRFTEKELVAEVEAAQLAGYNDAHSVKPAMAMAAAAASSSSAAAAATDS